MPPAAFRRAEGLRRRFDLAFGNAGPVVGDGDDQASIHVQSRPHRHLAAGVGEFHGIGQQVQQHPPQNPPVRPQRRQVVVRLAVDRQRPFQGVREDETDGLLEGIGDRHVFLVERCFAGFDLGKVEHVVGDGQQVFADLADVDGVGQVRLLGDGLGEPEDGVERGPQLVAHARQEFGFSATLRDRPFARLVVVGRQVLQAPATLLQGPFGFAEPFDIGFERGLSRA